MKQKVIVAGHICIDITPVFPEGTRVSSPGDILIPGKLIHMKGADVHTGGAVANTGLALRFLGHDVSLLGKVGNDAFGDLVKELLAKQGVSGLLTDGKSATSYSVVISVPGFDRIFLHDPGANDTFSSADIPEDALTGASLFHFGYPPIMRRMWENDGAELCDIFRRARDKGAATSLDFAVIDPGSEEGKIDWEALLRNILPLTDFFVPSFEELCFMLDREKFLKLSGMGRDMTEDLDMEADVLPLAEKALSMGCRCVLVKCGVSGMYFRSGKMRGIGRSLTLDTSLWADKSFAVSSYKPDVFLSGTGAGDASIAAFLAAIMDGCSAEESVELASAEGASAVTAFDALSGLLTLPELREKINAGWAKNRE